MAFTSFRTIDFVLCSSLISYADALAWETALTGISPGGYRPPGMDDDLPGADAGGGKDPPGTKGGAALDRDELTMGAVTSGEEGRGKTVVVLGSLGDGAGKSPGAAETDGAGPGDAGN